MSNNTLFFTDYPKPPVPFATPTRPTPPPPKPATQPPAKVTTQPPTYLPPVNNPCGPGSKDPKCTTTARPKPTSKASVATK